MSKLACPICRMTESRHKMDCHNAAYVEAELTAMQEAQKRVRAFPVALRKMWSGREVAVWIEEALQGRGYGL